MQERKIHAMHKRFGTCGLLRCKGCCHLIGGKYHDRQYYKCELYGLSHSEATDWRLSYQACGMYNVPQDMDRWVAVLDDILHAKKPALELQLAGQMKIDDFGL